MPEKSNIYSRFVANWDTGALRVSLNLQEILDAAVDQDLDIRKKFYDSAIFGFIQQTSRNECQSFRRAAFLELPVNIFESSLSIPPAMTLKMNSSNVEDKTFIACLIDFMSVHPFHPPLIRGIQIAGRRPTEDELNEFITHSMKLLLKNEGKFLNICMRFVSLLPLSFDSMRDIILTIASTEHSMQPELFHRIFCLTETFLDDRELKIMRILLNDVAKKNDLTVLRAYLGSGLWQCRSQNLIQHVHKADLATMNPVLFRWVLEKSLPIIEVDPHPWIRRLELLRLLTEDQVNIENLASLMELTHFREEDFVDFLRESLARGGNVIRALIKAYDPGYAGTKWKPKRFFDSICGPEIKLKNNRQIVDGCMEIYLIYSTLIDPSPQQLLKWPIKEQVYFFHGQLNDRIMHRYYGDEENLKIVLERMRKLTHTDFQASEVRLFIQSIATQFRNYPHLDFIFKNLITCLTDTAKRLPVVAVSSPPPDSPSDEFDLIFSPGNPFNSADINHSEINSGSLCKEFDKFLMIM